MCSLGLSLGAGECVEVALIGVGEGVVRGLALRLLLGWADLGHGLLGQVFGIGWVRGPHLEV